MPDRFHSQPEAVFPLWHVLADAAEWLDGTVLTTTVEPAPVFTPTLSSLPCARTVGLHWLIASLRRRPQRVTLDGLVGDRATLRVLDTETVGRAMIDPDAFRRSAERQAVVDGGLEQGLGPYAVVRVDIDD
jgi:hypothetical protein